MILLTKASPTISQEIETKLSCNPSKKWLCHFSESLRRAANAARLVKENHSRQASGSKSVLIQWSGGQTDPAPGPPRCQHQSGGGGDKGDGARVSRRAVEPGRVSEAEAGGSASMGRRGCGAPPGTRPPSDGRSPPAQLLPHHPGQGTALGPGQVGDLKGGGVQLVSPTPSR